MQPDPPSTAVNTPAPVEAPPASDSFETKVRLATSVIAPTTALTALMFYYGYVATTAEFGYFGISLGTLNLSTQEFLLRSVAALYIPGGALLLVVLASLWIHVQVTRHLSTGSKGRVLRLVAFSLLLLGVIAMGRGLVGVFVPAVARTEPIALSPMCLGVGVTALAYGRHLLLTDQSRPSSGKRAWPEQASMAAVAGLVLLSLFWAASSFAGAYGRGRAVDLSSRLNSRPAVVLDTTERFYITYPGIRETSLSIDPEAQWRYRYSGLRLLFEANDRMFLLPAEWNEEHGATLVVPSDSVRVQFYRG